MKRKGKKGKEKKISSLDQVNVNFNNLRQPKLKQRKGPHLVYRGQIKTTNKLNIIRFFFRSTMPLLESYKASDAQLLQSHPLNSAYNHPLPAFPTTHHKNHLF